MMYESKFVTAVMANGKILREHGDTVLIPFGAEYSLRFKNLNSVRALVKVSIDGTDATEGTSGLIVPANGSVDLERFIKNGNLAAGNAFKFIERTASIETGPRGIKMEDGLIRVEFEFERAYVPRYPYNTMLGGAISKGGSGDWVGSNATYSSSGTLRSRGISSNSSDAFLNTQMGSASDGLEAWSSTAAVNDIGITVPGSVKEQEFTVGAWFPTDGVKHVMVLKLAGQVGEVIVKTPVTVKTKPVCSTCGHVNKATNRFCSECGTSLQLV